MESKMFTMNFIKALLSQSDASGSKSTILKPLTWLIGILFGVLLTLAYMKADIWLTVIMVLLIIAIIILYIYVYCYCLHHNSDALRSESFSIRKMEIEKGMYGDSNTGLLERPSNNSAFIEFNNEEDGL